jgi:transketolase
MCSADPTSRQPKVIFIGTGSEVSLCVAAYEQLTAQGVPARVVSMPSWELFEAQSEEYRHAVLPPAITARVAVEAAAQFGWDRYIGPTGRFVGMHGYGASAPGSACFKHFGITTERVLEEAKAVLGA